MIPGYVVTYWERGKDKKIRVLTDPDDARNFALFRMSEGDFIEIHASICVLVHEPRQGGTWKLEKEQRELLETLVRTQVKDPPKPR